MTTTRLAIVTGGTRGIGLSIAKMLSFDHDVALLYKSDHENAKDALQSIEASSKNKIRVYCCDVSSPQLFVDTYQTIIKDYDKTCAVLVTCAGASSPALVVLQPLEVYDYLMRVNYLGVVNCCKTVVHDMIKNRYGRIVNVTSISAGTNVQGLSAYASTKVAVEKFSFILGGEVAKYGITVNTVRPGLVESKMTKEWLESFDKTSWTYKAITQPSNQLIEAQSIANAVDFLVKSSQVNCTPITVDGGNSVYTAI